MTYTSDPRQSSKYEVSCEWSSTLSVTSSQQPIRSTGTIKVRSSPTVLRDEHFEEFYRKDFRWQIHHLYTRIQTHQKYVLAWSFIYISILPLQVINQRCGTHSYSISIPVLRLPGSYSSSLVCQTDFLTQSLYLLFLHHLRSYQVLCEFSVCHFYKLMLIQYFMKATEQAGDWKVCAMM